MVSGRDRIRSDWKTQVDNEARRCTGKSRERFRHVGSATRTSQNLELVVVEQDPQIPGPDNPQGEQTFCWFLVLCCPGETLGVFVKEWAGGWSGWRMDERLGVRMSVEGLGCVGVHG